MKPSRAFMTQEFLASIVVFLVALPLCLGIAVASGLPPAAGLITGIIGGLVVGSLAGCPLQVSGPAAGLVTLVWDVVNTQGAAGLGAALILAGLMQFAAGTARLGRWFRAVSPAVVLGMLSAIGVNILMSQALVLLGLAPAASPVANGATLARLAIGSGVQLVHGSSAALGLATVIMLVAWDKLAPKRWRLVPAPLVAVLIGSFAAAGLGLAVPFVKLPDGLASGFSLAGFHRLIGGGWSDALVPALGIALVASAETLLCSAAVDRMRPGSTSNYDKELRAQGIGNALCGILGGLPLSGVIVRSSTNIGAGARTRASAIMHGFWLLGCVSLAAGMLARIPIPCLAAVLVVVGAKLVNPKGLLATAKQGRWELAVTVSTLAGVVAFGMLNGIALGFAVSLVKIAVNASKLQVEREHVKTDAAAPREILRLAGSATFLSVPRLMSALERLTPGGHVTLETRGLRQLDETCQELVRTWKTKYEAAGGTVAASLFDKEYAS